MHDNYNETSVSNFHIKLMMVLITQINILSLALSFYNDHKYKRFQNFKKKYLHFTIKALPAVFVFVCG